MPLRSRLLAARRTHTPAQGRSDLVAELNGNVLARDATGLQAFEDLRAKLHAKGKPLILIAPHTQPLSMMINSRFVDRLGEENVGPPIAAARLGLTGSLERAHRKLNTLDRRADQVPTSRP
ncbi:MAG: hypothetical protein JSR48_10405 [Verrucomicrobia bacterium]|nr:hypothetical protein [Verrucomicrobiota bacterium]